MLRVAVGLLLVALPLLSCQSLRRSSRIKAAAKEFVESLPGPTMPNTQQPRAVAGPPWAGKDSHVLIRKLKVKRESKGSPLHQVEVRVWWKGRRQRTGEILRLQRIVELEAEWSEESVEIGEWQLIEGGNLTFSRQLSAYLWTGLWVLFVMVMVVASVTPPRQWWLFLLCLVVLWDSGGYAVTLFDTWLVLLAYIPVVVVGIAVAAGLLSD